MVEDLAEFMTPKSSFFQQITEFSCRNWKDSLEKCPWIFLFIVISIPLWRASLVLYCSSFSGMEMPCTVLNSVDQG
jgi:hypothetical protein